MSTMRQMLEAGVHFGHQTRFWNPKMAPYIFGHRNKIHIINLEKTLVMYQDSMKYLRQLASNRGTVLFVGTKRQAREIVAQEARRAGMPYVDERWLGGMLTNFKTVKTSIKRLRDMEAVMAEGGVERMSKKEALLFNREMEKLSKAIGGIKDMNGLPDAIFVIDVGYHKIAITEAIKLDDGRVEMAARDVADGRRHREHGEAEGEGDAQEADPEIGIRGGEHGAAAAAEHEPEGADRLGEKFTGHESSSPEGVCRRVPPISGGRLPGSATR